MWYLYDRPIGDFHPAFPGLAGLQESCSALHTCLHGTAIIGAVTCQAYVPQVYISTCDALWRWTASAADWSEPLPHCDAYMSALLCFREKESICCVMLCLLHLGLMFNCTVSALAYDGRLLHALCSYATQNKLTKYSANQIDNIHDATNVHLLNSRTSPKSTVKGAFEFCSRAVLRSLRPRFVNAFFA